MSDYRSLFFFVPIKRSPVAKSATPLFFLREILIMASSLCWKNTIERKPQLTINLQAKSQKHRSITRTPFMHAIAIVSQATFLKIFFCCRKHFFFLWARPCRLSALGVPIPGTPFFQSHGQAEMNNADYKNPLAFCFSL